MPYKQLARFHDCGKEAWVIRSIEDPTRYRVAANTCHNRWCVPCQRDRSRVIARNLLELVEGKTTRFVTLTLRADGDSLTARVDRLHKCFAKLRKTLLWKRKVKGGAAFLEVQYNADRQSWHPHLHLIITGSYIPKVELSNTWLRITGDSICTDIRMAESPEKAAYYVTKYVSKPFDAAVTRDRAPLTEAVESLANAKMCITFGGFRGKLLTARPSDDSWEYVGSLDQILRLAKAGDVDARTAVSALHAGSVENALPHVTEPARGPPPKPIPNITRQTLLFAVDFE